MRRSPGNANPTQSVCNEQGTPLRIDGSSRDIIERKQAEVTTEKLASFDSATTDPTATTAT